MEDPKLTKTIVRREVTRVLTPGTAVDPALASERNNYLAALHVVPSGGASVAALALLDLSTGDFRATEFSGPGSLGFCIDELIKAQPSELLLSSGLPALDPLLEAEIEKIGTKTRLDEWVYTADYAIPLLERQMGASSLEGFGLASARAASIAAGAVVHYARSTQQIELQHVNTVRYYERAENLQLDAVTVRNLELIEPLFSGGAAPRSSRASKPWRWRSRRSLTGSNCARRWARSRIWSACCHAFRSTAPGRGTRRRFLPRWPGSLICTRGWSGSAHRAGWPAPRDSICSMTYANAWGGRCCPIPR